MNFTNRGWELAQHPQGPDPTQPVSTHTLCQQRGGSVWSEKLKILMTYSTIYANVGAWVGLKKAKEC